MEVDKPEISLDKIRGMFIGAFLGDSLGLPFEFDKSGYNTYTGKLDQTTRINTQRGTRIVPPGVGSDDTQMTIALLKCLLENNGYKIKHLS